MREATRRRWLGAAAAASLWSCGGAARAAAALAAPLERPATPLRQVGRVAMLGLARAAARIVAVGERGAVLLSDDDGASWRQASAVPVSVTLTAVQFADGQRGWAVGHQGVVLHSRDGGERWERQLDGARLARLELAEAEASGREAALAEARRAVQEGADKPLFAVHVDGAGHGIAVGAFGMAVATADGGRTWTSVRTRLHNPKSGHLYALSRQGQDLLLAGEQGLVLHSADAGRSFERLATPYQGSWFCAARDGTGAWVVAGLRGNALRSSDGGRTWSVLPGPAPVGYTAALTDAGGRVLLANQGGDIVAAEPGRAALVPVAGSPAQQPGRMLALQDGTLLLAGWNGLTRAPQAGAAR